jgi:hypothetical protein
MKSFNNMKQDFNAAESIIDSNTSALEAQSKEKHLRLSKRGQFWLCIGLFLMLLSFGLNFLFFHSEGSFITVMYIMTSIGACCILKGLVDILG